MKYPKDSWWDRDFFSDSDFHWEIDFWWDRDLDWDIDCDCQCIQRPKKKFRYNIDVEPDRTIKYVEFDYNKSTCKCICDLCGSKKVAIWLLVDGERTDVKCLSQCPCRWDLNKKVSDLKLVATKRLKPECMNTNVVYEEEPWIKLEPGESFPLPPEPPEISRITFEAKTEPGTTSEISMIAFGVITEASAVFEIQRMIVFSFFEPISVDVLELKNTGDSTIFIRNLTTE